MNNKRPLYARVLLGFLSLILATVQSSSVFAATTEQYYRDNELMFSTSVTDECTDTGGVRSVIPIEQKIAQTFLVGFDPSATAAIQQAVTTYKIGGVFPVGGNGDNSALTSDFFGSLNRAAGTPLFIAVDDEGGKVKRFGADVPSAAEMGALDEVSIQAKGKELGTKLRSMGLTADLAPVLDLTTTSDAFMTASERTWSSDADTVALKAGAFAKGLKEAGITPVFKHFPGLGSLTTSTDVGVNPAQSLASIANDLKPYRTLSAASGSAVMLGNNYISEWGTDPVSINKNAVDYLRNDIKFTGTIITDALNALNSDGYGSQKVATSDAVVRALNAGADMPMFIPSTDTIDSSIKEAIEAVKAGVTEERINAAFAKTLTLRNLPPASSANQSASLCCSEENSGPTSVSLSGANNTEKILNFLFSNPGYKFNLVQASGMVGNFFVEAGGTTESGNVSEKSMLLGPNPSADSKSSSTDLNDGFKGIAQWGLGRFSDQNVGLKAFAESQGKKWDDLDIQLRFLVWELGVGETWNGSQGGSESATLDILKEYETKTAEAGQEYTLAGEVAFKFEAAFERCGCTQEKRRTAGEEVYKYYADKPPLAASGSEATPAVVGTTTGTGKTVIAIDPGHGGAVDEYIDSVTGLADRETSNSPERSDVLEVANMVKADLEQNGYTVVLLRNAVDEAINKRARVDAAIAAKANLVVSIHTGPGTINEVWPQRVGTYREYDGKKVSITNTAVATASQAYADAIAAARKAAEGHDISLDTDNAVQSGSFNRTDVPSKGNVSLVQLFGQDIPWVYNEISQDEPTANAAITAETKQKYATGLINGIKTAISPTAGALTISRGCGSSFDGGTIAQTIKAYAWPEYHAPNFFDFTPAYEAAVKKAQSEGRYVGGATRPGIDCGGFVTTVMYDSGFDPTYNHSGKGGYTKVQEPWIKEHWKYLGGSDIDTATLKLGDVAFTGAPTHTFIFVGDSLGSDFGGQVASSSWGGSSDGAAWRTPMAGKESLTSSDIRWYSKQ